MDDSDPVAEGLVLATSAYFSGDLHTALRVLAAAETAARSGGEPMGLLLVLVQKASWLREIGSLGEGAKALAEAEHLLPRVSGPDHSIAVAAIRMEQGIVARLSGDTQDAKAKLEEALEESRKTSSPLLSDVLANLASAYFTEGKLSDAKRLITEAVKLDRTSHNDRSLSNDLNMLALVYAVTKDDRNAKRCFKEAAEVAARSGFLKEYADATANFAVTLEGDGKYDEAEAIYRTALDIYTRMGNKDEAANLTSSLGILAALRGQGEIAVALLTEAYRLHGDAGDVVHQAYDLLDLASAELSRPDGDAARYAASAVELAEKQGLLDILWAVYYVSAQANTARARKAKDAREQLTILNDDVLLDYSKAADAVELLRSGVGTPGERQHLFAGKEELYGEAMLLAATLQQFLNALVFAERGRARSFIESVGSARTTRYAAGDPLTRRREELTRAVLSDGFADAASRRAALDELLAVREQITAEAPPVAALTETDLPSLKSIKDAIPPDTVLIEYFCGPKNLLSVFVIPHKGADALRSFDLGTLNLDDEVAQFRAELEYEVPGTPAASLLYALLIDQIADLLENATRLIIVPHKSLNYIPFSALTFVLPQSNRKRYLCERFTISTLPSAAFLPICTALDRPAFRRSRALVLGNPTNDLPASVIEAESVAKHLGVKPKIGTEATRSAVLDNRSRGFAAVHVASHGVYEEADPLLSGLELADGRLTVEDLLESRLPAGLLSLSGCVTGLSLRLPGDELIGLARAAASAGIPSVVTSLWKVRDESAAAFFDQFYSALASGISKDGALAATQRSCIESAQFAHPVHWAPFVLMGDWR